MNPSQKIFQLRWRGKVHGPYSCVEVQRLLDIGEVGIYHEILLNGKWQNIQEWQNADKIRKRATALANEERVKKSNIESKRFHTIHEQAMPSDPKEESFEDDETDSFSNEIEEQFGVGSKGTTPKLDQIRTSFPKPKLFFRVLLFSLMCFGGFYWAAMQTPIAIQGAIFIGSFAVPFSVLVLFFELNVPRNVSPYRIFLLVVAGGTLAVIFTMLVQERVNLIFSTFVDPQYVAMFAGPAEETAKLAAVIFLTRKWRANWILNGILFGAAVGMGFAAFESAGYAFVALLDDFTTQNSSFESSIFIRGLSSPFTHILWTSIVAGAFWRVKGRNAFEWGMLLDWRFLKYFAFSVLMHSLWNSPVSQGNILFSCVIIGGFGWLLVRSLLQEGIEEIIVAQTKAKMA